jgi:hypothetical protein
MATFKKDQVVRLKAVNPEGPILKLRMDDDGTVYYLLSWTSDGMTHERWFTEDQLVAVE